jgi:hypothetical protein
MAVQQSEESFSTVGKKLRDWLNIVRTGANVIMAERRRTRGGNSGDDYTALFQSFPAAEIHGTGLHFSTMISLQRL